MSDPFTEVKALTREEVNDMIKPWDYPVDDNFDFQPGALESVLKEDNINQQGKPLQPDAYEMRFIPDWKRYPVTNIRPKTPEQLDEWKEVRREMFKEFSPQLPCIPTPNLRDLVDEKAIQWDRNPKNLQNWHPRFDNIRFVQGKHGERAYFIKCPGDDDWNCAHVQSSTGMPKVFFPFRAVGWEFKRLQKLVLWREKNKKKVQQGKKPLKCPFEPHFERCQTAQEIKAAATRPGSNHHKACELYLQDLLTPDEQKNLTHDSRICLQQFAQLRSGPILKHMEVHWVEAMIYHEDMLWATATDSLFYDPKTKTYVIVDHKRMSPKKLTQKFGFRKRNPVTGKCTGPWEKGLGIFQYMHNISIHGYYLQLNYVKFILETKYGMRISKMYLAQVHPSSEHGTLSEVPDMCHIMKHICQERARALLANRHKFKRAFPKALLDWKDTLPPLDTMQVEEQEDQVPQKSKYVKPVQKLAEVSKDMLDWI